jgi:hypothetical protein
MKRLAAELESVNRENQLLQMQLQRMQHGQMQQAAAAAAAAGGQQGMQQGQCSPTAEGSAAGGERGGHGGNSSGSRLDALEREMALLKQQVRGLCRVQLWMDVVLC